jgi:hypothetical protein
MVVGQFAVTPQEMANTSGESAKVIGGPGWHLRRAFMGPVQTITATAGSGFANGESVTMSNGSSNGTVILTTNATGNLVSGVVTSGGLFQNSSIVAFGFTREEHLIKLTVTGGSSPYSNTDYIIASNGIANAYLTVTTNATGFIVNTALATALAATANVGLWSNVAANASVVITVFAVGGGASAGAGATFVANLASSTAGTLAVATLGGRAGRVQYESLAFVHGITGGNTSTLLPS